MRLEEIKERLDSAGLLQLELPRVGGTPDEVCAAAASACAVACEPGGAY